MRQPSANKPQRRRRVDNIQKFTVKADAPLLEAAAAVLKDHKPTKLKSMLKHHQFAINGNPSSQFDRPVHAGDQLWVNFDGSFHIFSHPKMQLVYEDDDIMVIDKGYGMLSTAAGNNIKDETVYNVLRKYVKHRSEHARVYMVHRLDRDTSGLMLVARTAKARERFLTQWATLVSERKYEAIVEGVVEEDSGLVQNYLRDADNYTMVSDPDDEQGGELAKTRYKVLERASRFTRVELSMRHGHKNQLRVHMHDLGCPISGDRKYGGRANGIHRLALHATRICFEHPITGEKMTFESPIPASFHTLMR
ncbi:MAG: RluA family pseudouridine synthase [Bacteroidales bacterium]|nr:RluA family pseudouridine synthase [Bacteroidales bacterium]